MGPKSEFLQIRVTPEQKEAVRTASARAGLDMSAFVLERLLPSSQRRFNELVKRLTDQGRRAYALAELNDLLASLSATEMSEALANPPVSSLSPYLQNYVAAMVEQGFDRQGCPPPKWVNRVAPLEEPRFVGDLPALRLHLLKSAPVPFRRRNIFVDSAVGDRV